MSPSKSRSASKSGKTKKYVLLKQPTLLKDKSLSKQGKEISTTKSPSQWVAMYAMALYSKRYKQLGSAFLYRKGTVYRYNITFKSKSGRKCATAKLTSRSVCKVTGGKPGKSRSCRSHGSASLASKKKSLSRSRSDVKKATKSLSASKKRVSKAKKALSKTRSGSSSRTKAKKRVKKASKEMSSNKRSLTKLRAQVKKKSKEVKRMSRSLR